MCGRFALSAPVATVRRNFALREEVVLTPRYNIAPTQQVAVVREGSRGRELTMMRWGFPPPPKVGNRPVTNVRNVNSPYWRTWLDRFRCLVPATSF